ncbi:MAG TPA: TIGR01212 family radical SAM protein [Bacteroidales bacterium]|nr:TIGR01212 family radical SAM protein [Bacteroidales bacterium]
MHKLYYSFPEFIGQYFKGKIQKISLDAGFSCPNRDGSLGRGGCSYCNNLSFNPSYSSTKRSISEQLAEGKEFFAHKYPKMDYLAYFQSYTNTYDKLDRLIDLYEEALRFPGVKGLVIATRPDCLPDDLLDYLEQLAKRCFLLVELGLESTLDRTLKEVGRGHDYACSVNALNKIAQRRILCGAHIILGLPGESKEDMLAHAGRLNTLPLTTLKLHQLQLIRGIRLEEQVRNNPAYVHFFDAGSYARLLIDFIERLRPGLVLDRFVSQAPAEWLIGPDWGLKNYEFTHQLEKMMRAGGHYQGRLYSGSNN